MVVARVNCEGSPGPVGFVGDERLVLGEVLVGDHGTRLLLDQLVVNCAAWSEVRE